MLDCFTCLFTTALTRLRPLVVFLLFLLIFIMFARINLVRASCRHARLYSSFMTSLNYWTEVAYC